MKLSGNCPHLVGGVSRQVVVLEKVCLLRLSLVFLSLCVMFLFYPAEVQ